MKVVDLLQQHCTRSASGVSGGLVIRSPWSFALCCHSDMVFFFDSHSRGLNGELIAKMPASHAHLYLARFFYQHGLVTTTDISNFPELVLSL